MKTSVLSSVAIALLFINVSKVNAQCTVNPPTISLVSANANLSGNCVVTFNITFDMPNANGGNKFENIHIWTSAAYASLPSNLYGNTNNNAPTVADLNTYQTLVTLTIDNSLSTTQCYARNGSSCAATQPTSLQTGNTVIKTINGNTITYSINNVTTTIPGACTSAATLKADVWGDNSSSNNSIACISRGFSFSPTEINISGFKSCSSPKLIDFNVYTNGSVPAKFTYRIYKDNGNNSFDPGDADVTLSSSLTDTITITTSGPAGQVGRSVGYTGNTASPENGNYWVVITPVGGTFSVSAFIPNSVCGPLPVKLTSFQGNLNNNKVFLNWTVASNETTDHFEVERSTDGNNFSTAALVFSTDKSGDESYQYSELMSAEKVFYRLRMTDKSQDVAYSKVLVFQSAAATANNEIRIMSNPVNDKLSFSFQSNKDQQVEMKVIDIMGRTMMKQNMNAYQGTNVVSMPLNSAFQSGLYIVDLTAGAEHFSTKFVKQ